jgi:hypothetical protein
MSLFFVWVYICVLLDYHTPIVDCCVEYTLFVFSVTLFQGASSLAHVVSVACDASKDRYPTVVILITLFCVCVCPSFKEVRFCVCGSK